VCVCARVRVRALRSYLWLKLYKVSQCTRSTRIPMRAPGASQPGDQRRVANDGSAYTYLHTPTSNLSHGGRGGDRQSDVGSGFGNGDGGPLFDCAFLG